MGNVLTSPSFVTFRCFCPLRTSKLWWRRCQKAALAAAACITLLISGPTFRYWNIPHGRVDSCEDAQLKSVQQLSLTCARFFTKVKLFENSHAESHVRVEVHSLYKLFWCHTWNPESILGLSPSACTLGIWGRFHLCTRGKNHLMRFVYPVTDGGPSSHPSTYSELSKSFACSCYHVANACGGH